MKVKFHDLALFDSFRRYFAYINKRFFLAAAIRLQTATTLQLIDLQHL